jgi:hypothetical protein
VLHARRTPASIGVGDLYWPLLYTFKRRGWVCNRPSEQIRSTRTLVIALCESRPDRLSCILYNFINHHHRARQFIDLLLPATRHLSLPYLSAHVLLHREHLLVTSLFAFDITSCSASPNNLHHSPLLARPPLHNIPYFPCWPDPRLSYYLSTLCPAMVLVTPKGQYDGKAARVDGRPS